MKRWITFVLALALLAGLAPAALAEEAPAGLTQAPLAEEAPPVLVDAALPQEEAPAPLDGAKTEGGDKTVGTLQELENAVKNVGSYQLTADIPLTAELAVSKNVTLDLNGYTLTAASGKRHFKVEASGNFTLTDSSSPSTGKLQGPDAGAKGGGVDVYKGTFIMTGGTITDCTNNSGVYVNGGTFTMKGNASIANCTSVNGGGVYATNSTFTMEENSSITGCTATNGGGVLVDQSTSKMIGSATIANCEAAGGGGGVRVNSGSFTLEDSASITDCKADNASGGGVLLIGGTNGGAFTMSNGTITDCTATYGGGVQMMGGTLEMNGGAITDCTATESGGGMRVMGVGNFTGTATLAGGAITGCTAAYGGGVHLMKGALEMENGAITGCEASKSGGGVCAENSTLTLQGGDIGQCKASSGGGVYLTEGSTLAVSASPKVQGNTVGGKADNIGMEKGAQMKVDALGSDVSLGLTLYGEGWEKEDVFLTDASGDPLVGDDTLKHFVSDGTGETLTGAEFGDFPLPAPPEPPAPPAVIVPDTGLMLDQTSLTLEPGQTAKLKAALTPADATYKYIFWASSDEAVATVSDSGLVTALADGTAVITAKSWYGNEATCEVTVKTPDKPIPPDAPDDPAPADPWPTEGLEGFVTRCYRVALSRDPDKAGHADWVHWLQDGTVDATSCTYGFVFSKEMNNKKLSDEAFVKTLYKLFMDREGEATGITFWTDYLKAGHSREEVFHGFADSSEFARLKANYGIR